MADSTKDVNLPEVLEEIGELGSDKHKLIVRIIRYQHPLIGKSKPMLDIRRFFSDKKNLDGSVYTGFGHGVSLTEADLTTLSRGIPEILDKIKSFSKG